MMDGGAIDRAKQLGVAIGGLYILVLREYPEAGTVGVVVLIGHRLPPDRRFAAKRIENLVRKPIAVQVAIQEIDIS